MVRFEGFPPDALEFLAELSFNNNREWFQTNRSRFDEGIKPALRSFIAAASDECAKLELPLRGDPESSSFRLHRDVRFSKDKSPYKTNLGIVLTREAIKHMEGLLYFHLAPSGCFVACGFYQPRPELVAAFRTAISESPETWLGLEKSLPKLSDMDSLTRIPRGFEAFKASPIDSALKLKSYIASEEIDPDVAESSELPRKAAEFAKKMLPLLEYGWKIRDDLGPLPER